jgi:hypothetical protein
MKRTAFSLTLIAIAIPAWAADVGVSVTVNQPGIFGRIDIGNLPPPQLIYAEPMLIRPVPHGEAPPPIYLHVQPGHEKNWRKHCAKYNACGRPVYFVHEDWYRKEYEPRHREGHGDRRHGDGRDQGRQEERDQDRGRGEGRGKGHRDE